MAETIQYKCPCCGGRLEFDSGLQKMKCPYCDTTFDVETLEGYDDALKQDAKDDMHWDAAQQPWDDVQMGVYTCKSCGGELVCDESTAATACPFCGNPIVLTGRLSGDLKPDYVIPFKLDKKAAEAALRNHMKGKRLLPNLFRSENRISEVKGYTVDGNDTIPCEGVLYYRGYDVRELVNGSLRDKRFGFEETIYLLLFGELPTAAQLEEFRGLLNDYCGLPGSFVRDVIMKVPTGDMMNTLARAILTLYCYDNAANDISLPNALRQCLQLIANTPQLAIYSYQAYRARQGHDLYLHVPNPELSMAENILYLLRADKQYTELEARALDAALILHADHGSNNSTFTNHVTASTGTDTYSAMTASLCSLKGPRHGGANAKVVQMMADLRSRVQDPADPEQVRQYLTDLLAGRAYVPMDRR